MKKEVLIREVLWSLSRRRKKSKTRLFIWMMMSTATRRPMMMMMMMIRRRCRGIAKNTCARKGGKTRCAFRRPGGNGFSLRVRRRRRAGRREEEDRTRVGRVRTTALESVDFVEEEEEEEEEDDDGTPRLFVPSIPSTRRLANDDDDGGGMTGPFVWQIMDARDVSRGKSTAATTAAKEARERRMLKVTMTDGYSRVIVLERMRWSNVDQAPERWERQLMPGTKVLVRDLKQSTTMRSGRMDEDLVVFADDERNFEILGGRVDKLKEKFEDDADESGESVRRRRVFVGGCL